MSYLFVVIIGAVAGWVAGQFIKGSELGVVIDVVAGAAGSLIGVILARMFGPVAASGFVISSLVSVIAGVVALYSMRRFMKARLVPAVRPRRRY